LALLALIDMLMTKWAAALKKCPEVAVETERVSTDGAPDPNTASVLWNGMVTPLLPMYFVGVFWYQGARSSVSLFLCFLFPCG
jgi:hypothetical protein